MNPLPTYFGVVHKVPGEPYVVIFPDFLGLSAYGKSRKEAGVWASLVLSEWVEVVILGERKEPIPPPMPEEAAIAWAMVYYPEGFWGTVPVTLELK